MALLFLGEGLFFRGWGAVVIGSGFGVFICELAAMGILIYLSGWCG